MADWRQIEDDREKYAAYLCSREWAELKDAVHRRAKGKCERCNTFQIDAVHHLTYERKYHELPEDLQGNCKHCHNFTHGKSNFDPAGADKWMARYIQGCVEAGRHPVPMHCTHNTCCHYPRWQSIMLAIDQLTAIQDHGKDGCIPEIDEAVRLLDSKLPFAYADAIAKGMHTWDFEVYYTSLKLFGMDLEEALPEYKEDEESEKNEVANPTDDDPYRF